MSLRLCLYALLSWEGVFILYDSILSPRPRDNIANKDLKQEESVKKMRRSTGKFSFNGTEAG